MKIMFLNTAIVSAFFMLSEAYAESGNPHVHGSAAMNMAIDNEQVYAEFEAPMASIVGFEYQPQTKIEKLKVRKAIDALESDKLFGFSGASCNLDSVETELPWKLSENDHDQHHAQNKHSEHSKHHHDEHEHDEHENDQHDHNKHDGHGHEFHGNVTIKYQFSCESFPESVSLNYFEPFPLMESLKVQWISGMGQGAASLTSDKKVVSFK